MRKVLLLLAGLMIGLAVHSQTVIYHENFELPTLADSVVSSGTPNPWAVNTRIYASGLRCDSNYVQVNDTSYLTTLSFNCTAYSYVVLNFDHICKIELLDAGEIEVSVNNGVTWTKLTATHYLTAGSQFGSNGNKFNSNAYPLLWQPMVSTAVPTNAWWKNEQFDISSIAANQANVKVRFALRDGNGSGANFNRGWFIDNINIVAAIAELTPPVITYLLPLLQDTVYSTGPFDVFAGIKDASGIDTAWITYKIDGGTNQYIPMSWISDSTYKATIPAITYQHRIDYYIHAEDGSANHNMLNATAKWYYISRPSVGIIVGTGTAADYYPFNMYSGYTRSASIYPASSINQFGLIKSLAWQVSYANAVNSPVKIYLKTTTATTLTSVTWANMITGATLVYDGTQNFPSAGWKTITLTTPYNYASGNLMVLCVAEYGSYGYYSPPEFYYSTATSQHETWSSNSTAPTGSGTVGNNRPNITIFLPGTFKAPDAGVTQVLNPPANTASGVDLPVNIIFKNFGSDTLEKVSVAWKIDGVLQTPFAWTGSLPEDIVSTSLTIGTINVGVGSHTLKVWTEMPNDSTDHNHANDTITMNFFACSSPLAGTYTIGGAGADFSTFTDALTGLNNCGISSAVTFLVNSGTYNEQLTFQPIIGASVTNTVTFRPNTGANVTLTNNSTSTILFNGADYITFDGSNNGTSTRDMSVVNTSTSSSTAAIQITSLGAGAGAIRNTIKNCNIAAGSSTSSTYGIFVGAAIGTAGADNDYITLRNNVIEKAYYGIYVLGIAANANDSLKIIDNSIGSATAAKYIGYYGIYATQCTGAVVSGNTIYNIITTSSTPVGINISTGFVNAIISKNKINTIHYAGTSGYGGRGIYVNTGSATSNISLVNNMIGTIGGDGYSSFGGSSPVGIFLDGTTGGLDIYYNSVYMSGNMTYSSGSTSAAMLLNSTTITSVNMRNNVFVNTMLNTASATYKQFAIYSVAPKTAFTSINYNDYYVSGAQGVLGYLGANTATLAAWKTATAQDANSVNVPVEFVSATNLHTYSSSINNLGVAIPAFTDDIDGEIRHATTPDLGSDEFTPLANDIYLVSILSPSNGCVSNTAVVQLRFKNVGGDPILSAEMYYTLNGGSPVHETFTGNVASNATQDFTFATLADVSMAGNFVINAWVDLAGDPNTLNDSVNNYTFYNGYNFNMGAYTMGFESTEFYGDWSVLDVNADTRTWQIPYAGYARTGSNSARFYNSGTVTGNDWLFSRCFKLEAGNTYKIDFWYRAESSTYPQKVTLKYGNAATAGAMTNTLATLNNFSNVAYQLSTSTFTATTSGVYYFGWWATSSAANTSAYVDDINIKVLPAQEAATIAISSPASGCGLSNAEPVTLMIKNTGTAAITGNLTAYYQIGAAVPVSEPVTTAIPAGDTLDFTFATPADLYVTGQDSLFSFTAWVTLTGDPISNNDSTSKEVSSRIIPDPPVVANVTIPYGTYVTLTAAAADSVAWYDAMTGGNILGYAHSFTTPVLYGTTVYYAGIYSAPGLFIEGLSADNSVVVDHDTYTGDDRGGIAATKDYVYIIGDGNSVRYNMPDLTNPVSFIKRDGIFSDLAGNGTLYTLWNGTTDPVGSSLTSPFVVSAIKTLNNDLSLGATTIPLSESFSMGTSSTCAVFSGATFAILYTGTAGTPANTFFKIELATGTVTEMGTYTLSAAISENWARWGVAEILNSEYYVSYVGNNDEIERLNLETGMVTTVATFTNLNDMSNFTVAPWYNRWYFHHENSSQFGGSSETGGYADALVNAKLICPSNRAADTVFITGTPSCDVSITAISAPVSGIELTNAEAVTVTVVNYGSGTVSDVPVNYTINGGAAVTGVIAGPLAAGADTVYTFLTPANLSATDSTYIFDVFTSLACDTIYVNDTLSATVVNNPLVYCSSEASYTYDNDIGNVTFATINNGVASPILSNSSSVNTYTDFTALPPAHIMAGASVPIAITKIEDDTYFYDCQINVYIDWNRNGLFDLPGELVFGQTTGYDETSPTITGVVDVPYTGVIGGQTLLMRVVLDEYGSALPCGSYSYGETEDYYVIVDQLPLDAGVTSIVQPASIEDEGEVMPVSVMVTNFGTDMIGNATGLNVHYSLNGQAPVSMAWNAGNILPGTSVAIDLPNVTIPSGDAGICAWTSLIPDTNFQNDSSCIEFYGNPHFDAGVVAFLQPVSMNGFESAATTVEVLFTNHGSDTLLSVPVSYSINGVTQSTLTWTGILSPGSSDTMLFTQTYDMPAGSYEICAFTGVVADGDHNNDTLCAVGVGLITTTLPYYDDFDGAVNWSTENLDPGTVWELGTPAYDLTSSAHSAPNAWDVNLSTSYDSYALSYLYTQNFNFTGITNARIAFWINVDAEEDYDGLTLQYSTDSSNSWQSLGTVGDPLGTNWYTSSASSYEGWVSTGGWIRAEYPLTALNNKPSVRFRYLFYSDVSGEYSGASLDDFALYVPSPVDAGIQQIKQPAGNAPAGTSKVVKVLIKNYGSGTLNSIPVSYAVNGGTPVNATWNGTLLPNDTISYTFTTPMILPQGLYTLCAYTGAVGDGDHMNDTNCVDYSGIMTFIVPWADDMESAVYFYDEGGNASWEYGLPTSDTINSAHSPVNCWKTNLDGNYLNNSADFLYTPYFDFTQVADATLDFWHWYHAEDGFDGGKIEYSLNSGSTWITLGIVNDPAATNWYNDSFGGSSYWTGSSAGWIHSTFNLSTIPSIVNATAPVQFRYKFYSDGSTNDYDGWAVDDFAIIAPPIAKDAGVIAVVSPSGSTMTGSAVTVEVTIKNFGTDSLRTVPLAYTLNGGPLENATWTGVLMPAATVNYTFTATFTAPGSDYDLCAFTKRSGDIYRFNDTTCVSIASTPAPIDCGVIAVLSPTDSTLAGSTVSVQMRIKNFGTNVLTSIPVGYSRNGIQVATATWTGSLAYGDSADYTFTQTYISPLSNYSLCGYTMLPGDADNSNNQSCAYPLGHVGLNEYSGDDFFVWQNIPNPSNATTSIEYQIPGEGPVKFEVRNILGQVMFSSDESMAAGRHRIELNVNPWSTGLYYYTVEFGGKRVTKKMLVTR